MLEDHLFSALRYCLFNISAATFHIGGRSYIRNLRTRHAVVTETHLLGSRESRMLYRHEDVPSHNIQSGPKKKYTLFDVKNITV
jgi:hypothetical protein